MVALVTSINLLRSDFEMMYICYILAAKKNKVEK